jgi:aspartate aminotransferase-like enzyme
MMASPKERIVIAPGPVHVHGALRGAVEPVHHRSPVFRAIVRETESMIAELLGTEAPVYLLTSSGTGAMEAVAGAVARPGDRVLVVSGGKFGDRWGEIFQVRGCRSETMQFEWGEAIDTGAVAEAARAGRPDIIACTHVESSTGLLIDIEGLAKSLPEPRPVLVVDAIASLGAEELEMDGWEIDAVAAASQKAFGSPPGVGFAAVGLRALERTRRPGAAGYYFDLSRYEEGRERGDAPFTPAIETMQIVHAALARSREAGWSEMRRRHSEAASAFTAALRHCSLDPFPQQPSAAVQAFRLPDNCIDANILELLDERHGVVAAGGQGSLEGRIVRTGFLGLHGGRTLEMVVSAFADVLEGLGCAVDRASAEGALVPVAGLEEIFV